MTSATDVASERIEVWTDFRGEEAGRQRRARILLSVRGPGVADQRLTSRWFAADRVEARGRSHHLGYLFAIVRALRLGADLSAPSITVYTPCIHALELVSGATPVDEPSVGAYLQAKALLRCFDSAEIRVVRDQDPSGRCALESDRRCQSLPGMSGAEDKSPGASYSVSRRTGAAGRRCKRTRPPCGHELSELWGGNRSASV